MFTNIFLQTYWNIVSVLLLAFCCVHQVASVSENGDFHCECERQWLVIAVNFYWFKIDSHFDFIDQSMCFLNKLFDRDRRRLYFAFSQQRQCSLRLSTEGCPGWVCLRINHPRKVTHANTHRARCRLTVGRRLCHNIKLKGHSSEFQTKFFDLAVWSTTYERRICNRFNLLPRSLMTWSINVICNCVCDVSLNVK